MSNMNDIWFENMHLECTRGKKLSDNCAGLVHAYNRLQVYVFTLYRAKNDNGHAYVLHAAFVHRQSGLAPKQLRVRPFF